MIDLVIVKDGDATDHRVGRFLLLTNAAPIFLGGGTQSRSADASGEVKEGSRIAGMTSLAMVGSRKADDNTTSRMLFSLASSGATGVFWCM